jgi:hypothetical protein
MKCLVFLIGERGRELGGYIYSVMTDLEVQRICMECGQRIVGRTDKKFCNDHCRTAWHNKMHYDEASHIKSINTILRKNRKILAELRASGARRIPTVALMRLGFEFGYFTSMKKSRSGILHYCYEQSYVPMCLNKIKFIKLTE